MTEHVVGVIWDAWRAKRQGRKALAARQTSRLVDMIAYARARSPFYGELYRDLPDSIEDPRQLPVTDKKMLMERFDEGCTDRDVTLQAAEAVVDDPGRIGERFLGKYTLATTSGTTGRRGIFLTDDRTMAVVTAIMLRWMSDWLSPSDIVKIVARRGRLAMVMATGGHFASAVAAARLKRRRGNRVEILSAHMPMAELVERLNRFQPALLTPYASMAAMLADEQEAGRLHIGPVLLALSAEGLPQPEYGRIARAFGAKVGNSYAASECMFLSYMCSEGWLHVNADWVAFEPVDADYRPVAPGEQSHTILISNLANRVQPILRYDLGDIVLQRPDPCPCGNPLPAIRVQGRSADVSRSGRRAAMCLRWRSANRSRLSAVSRSSSSCRPRRKNLNCACRSRRRRMPTPPARDRSRFTQGACRAWARTRRRRTRRPAAGAGSRRKVPGGHSALGCSHVNQFQGDCR